MIQRPMDVLLQYPIRKNRKQKERFRQDVQSFLQGLGYVCRVDKGNFGVRNVVIGDPEKAKIIVTAHYDTCARLPFPNLITPCNFLLYLLYQICIIFAFMLTAGVVGILMGLLLKDSILAGNATLVCYWILLFLLLFGPANKNNANDNTSGVVSVLEIACKLPEQYRDKVCFVLFDLEEAGLIGSSAYQQKYKKFTKQQTVLNMDCVGEGNVLMLFPTGRLKKEAQRMEQLRKVTGNYGDKTLSIRDKGFSFYPSDQSNFPYGVGVAAFNYSQWAGPYLARIHTNKDTILDEENVAILRDTLINYIISE